MLDGEVCHGAASAMDLFPRRLVQHLPSNPGAKAIGRHQKVVCLDPLAVLESDLHSVNVVALPENLHRFVEDEPHPFLARPYENLGQRTPEDFGLGGEALHVRSARGAECPNGRSIFSDKLHALLVGRVLADLLLRAHPLDDVDRGAADVDARACETEGGSALDEGDVGIGVGAEEPEGEDAAGDSRTGNEDFERLRHHWRCEIVTMRECLFSCLNIKAALVFVFVCRRDQASTRSLTLPASWCSLSARARLRFYRVGELDDGSAVVTNTQRLLSGVLLGYSGCQLSRRNANYMTHVCPTGGNPESIHTADLSLPNVLD